jgi:signal transduction histidine kinase
VVTKVPASPAAEAKGVELGWSAGDAGTFVTTGDEGRLLQVVANLLHNAVKFTPCGGRVTVTLAREGGAATLRVADTGAGIAPEFLPCVFDRFRQADASATRVHGGLGLGLSIVKMLAELHGGRVEAESEGPGRGSTFTVHLPLQAAPLPIPALRGDAAPGLRGMEVVVLDADADRREALRLV